MSECTPYLLEQHPQLSSIDASSVNRENWKDWLNEQVARFGETLIVRPLAEGQHVHIDPVAELEKMMGKDRVITVILDDSSDIH